MKIFLCGVVCILLIPFCPGFAQPSFDDASISDPKDPLIPKRNQVGVTIDGHLDEEVWAQLTPIRNWYQQSPNKGGRPTEQTLMWMTYDNEAVYIGAKLFEQNPKHISTKSLERDTYTLEEDAIGVIFDTSNDERTAYGFIVTPAGVRTDIAISNNARSDWNQNWNTFWSAATHQTADGWVAEIRIPFTSLRFEPSGGQSVDMGMILWRYMARNAEYEVFPTIPNNWGNNSAFKPSEAQTVTFNNVTPRSPLYIKPYALTGLEQENVLYDGDNSYQSEQDFRREVGLDVKYNITSNLILDVTANTDFAQVEADDQQINLSRFSLFLPEKRDFFQERSDLFEFRFPGGQQRIFQSRKIGIYDGRLVPIIGGARLTGSIRKWDLGVLNMQTGETMIDNQVIPSENFGVFRVQRTLFNESSYVGGMFTSRTDLAGNYNLVYAADADINYQGDEYVAMQFAQSVEPGVALQESNIATLLFQRRIQRGFSYGTSFKHTGKTFNPAAGFLQRSGVNR